MCGLQDPRSRGDSGSYKDRTLTQSILLLFFLSQLTRTGLYSDSHRRFDTTCTDHNDHEGAAGQGCGADGVG